MRIETHSTLKPTSLKILTSRKWGFCSLPRRNGSEDEIAACVSMTCGFMCWQTIKSQIPLKSIITQVNYQSSQLPLKSIISQVNYHSSQLSVKSITTQVKYHSSIYMPIILVVNFTVTDLMAIHMNHLGGSGKDPVKKVTNTSGQGY